MLRGFGTSIYKNGLEQASAICESAQQIVFLNDRKWCIVAVASGKGAQMAVKAAIENIVKNSPVNWHEENIAAILYSVFQHAESELQKQIDIHCTIIKKADACFILALYDGCHIAYGQCGCGGIVAITQDGGLLHLNRPQNEYIPDGIVPLHQRESWFFSCQQLPVRAVLIMTSGIYRSIVPALLRREPLPASIWGFMQPNHLNYTDEQLSELFEQRLNSGEFTSISESFAAASILNDTYPLLPIHAWKDQVDETKQQVQIDPAIMLKIKNGNNSFDDGIQERKSSIQWVETGQIVGQKMDRIMQRPIYQKDNIKFRKNPKDRFAAIGKGTIIGAAIVVAAWICAPIIASDEQKSQDQNNAAATNLAAYSTSIDEYPAEINSYEETSPHVFINAVTHTPTAPRIIDTPAQVAATDQPVSLQARLADAIMPYAQKGNFPKQKRYAVYSGPGEFFTRGAKGKAIVSTNDWIDVLGTDNGWTLIQYEVNKNKWRRGYVQGEWDDRSIISQNVIAICIRAVAMTDDPIMSQEQLLKIPSKAQVVVIGVDGDWAYVEYKSARGYIPLSALELE